MDQNKLIKFEFDVEGEKIELHLNDEGIDSLIEQLLYLKKEGKNEHLHLMTPAWGGDELSEGKTQEGFNLINHVKIYRWD